MRLAELNPEFVRWFASDDFGGRVEIVSSLAKANGLKFLCPVCLRANEMKPEGVHSIRIYWGSVPQEAGAGPGRWNPTPTSTGVENLTLTGHVSTDSIKLVGGCNAHFHIQAGAISFS